MRVEKFWRGKCGRRGLLSPLLLALGTVAAAAQAQSMPATAPVKVAQPTSSVEQAKNLIEQKAFKQAYALLAPEEKARAGEPEFDYWLGVAAYESDFLERAAMAFERVLTLNPEADSARLELARTLFRMGSLDLAEQEFNRLSTRTANADGQALIAKYLAEIVRLKAKQKLSISSYVELIGGRDSNITSSTRDFSQAVFTGFGFPGILPTGNSVKRADNFLGINAGAEYLNRYREDRTIFASAGLRARGYREFRDYNLGLLDATVGHEFRAADVTWQMTAFAQQFAQEGAKPDASNPVAATNDRRSGGLGFEVKKRMSGFLQLASGLQLSSFRYKDNKTQDTDQATVSVTALMSPANLPGVSFTAASFYSVDRAKRPLNALGDTDVSRKTAGLRFGFSSDVEQTLSFAGSLGWTRRNDDKPFARALLIAKGRDDLADVTLRATWKLSAAFTIQPYLTYLSNRSNIALYTFSKTEGGVGLRYDYK